METIPVQCVCTQCDLTFTPDQKRCPKCIVNPKRKNRIVRIFDSPKILSTMANKQFLNQVNSPEFKAIKRVLDKFVFFKCQRPGCSELVCRRLKMNGTLAEKNYFCTGVCCSTVTGLAKQDRETKPCGCGCGNMVTRRKSHLWSTSFYSSRHYQEWRKQKSLQIGHEHKCNQCLKKWKCQKPNCFEESTRGHDICDRCFDKALKKPIDMNKRQLTPA